MKMISIAFIALFLTANGLDAAEGTELRTLTVTGKGQNTTEALNYACTEDVFRQVSLEFGTVQVARQSYGRSVSSSAWQAEIYESADARGATLRSGDLELVRCDQQSAEELPGTGVIVMAIAQIKLNASAVRERDSLQERLTGGNISTEWCLGSTECPLPGGNGILLVRKKMAEVIAGNGRYLAGLIDRIRAGVPSCSALGPSDFAIVPSLLPKTEFHVLAVPPAGCLAAPETPAHVFTVADDAAANGQDVFFWPPRSRFPDPWRDPVPVTVNAWRRRVSGQPEEIRIDLIRTLGMTHKARRVLTNRHSQFIDRQGVIHSGGPGLAAWVSGKVRGIVASDAGPLVPVYRDNAARN